MTWLAHLVLGRIRVLLVILGLAGIALVLATWWQPFLVHLSEETGTSTSASRAYNFWSGFGSDMGEVTLLGAIFGLWRAHNCHTKRCWRLGRHTTPEGHKLCAHCVTQPRSALDLPTVHPDHR